MFKENVSVGQEPQSSSSGFPPTDPDDPANRLNYHSPPQISEKEHRFNFRWLGRIFDPVDSEVTSLTQWNRRAEADGSGKFVPYWTDPEWDPQSHLEISADETHTRPTWGQAAVTARPALLSSDALKLPTQYAR